jgi:hypothetical protein
MKMEFFQVGKFRKAPHVTRVRDLNVCGADEPDLVKHVA